MSDISLYLDQDNELLFNVSIEGSKPGLPKYRLVLEGKDCSYAFAGQQAAPGEVTFAIPSMKNVLKEGRYHTNLEVMVDDRFFVPLQFSTELTESIKVVAEAAYKPAVKKATVTASIANVSTNRNPPVVLEASNRARQEIPKINSNPKPAVGEIDGRKVTVDDLRSLIRQTKKN